MTAGAQTQARLRSRGAYGTLAAIIAITLLSWWYLFDMAAGMSSLDMGMMMALKPWTVSYFVLMFLMWTIMMIAMMLPSATPMILLYRQVATHNRLPRIALGTVLFVGGYVIVWTLFSLLATTLQWLLEQGALLSPMMKSQNLLFSGLLLIAVGAYQWSPWKNACLRHCRGPFFFISSHWRPGLAGAFRMGLVHGVYCTGCCMALMVLLFVGGIMNLTVIALIALIVLLEKVIPHGEWLARGLGAVSAVAGIAVVASALA